MSNKDICSDASGQQVDSRHIVYRISGTDIGCHGTKELRESCRIHRKLYPFIIIRPFADAPDIEPELLIGLRLNGRFGRSFSGSSTPRQIHHIRRISFAQHEGGKSFASIRCRCPSHSRSSVTVYINNRMASSVYRYLIINVSMIDVHGLPCFVRRKKSGKSLSVVNAFALDLLSADGKTPLPFNYQMMLIGDCMLVRTAYKRRSGEYCHDDFRFHVILYYKDDYLFTSELALSNCSSVTASYQFTPFSPT